MDKEFWILQLSSLVFYITSLLLGLHIAYIFSFFLNSNKSVHMETISVFYSSANYSFSVAPTELIHMKEVGELLQLSHVLFVLFFVFSGFLLWYLLRRKYSFGRSFFILPIATIVFLLGAIMFFDFFFEIFHIILFTNEYWLFNPLSPILRTYPHSFFMIELVILIICSLSVYFAIYRFLKKKD